MEQDPKTDAQLALVQVEEDLLPDGPAYYRHYKGGRYLVLAITVFEGSLEPLVHYYSSEHKTRWTRTVRNFRETIGVGPAATPRFTRTDELVGHGDILHALGMKESLLPKETR